ncbi:hypothetical protein AB0F13_27655 [Streptomyces sp. NPDC026206]|uniref:hypothetical protein n=1 Tax=Streptomyces sp. NPDC026206 TaxID=3157089 RepID=UPI0033CAEBC0
MTSEPLQIPLDQLRHDFDVMLRQVEASAGLTMTLDKEYFWSVPGDELYDVLSLTLSGILEFRGAAAWPTGMLGTFR